jgi:hypothetical protein
LERYQPLLQLGKITFENLAPPTLVCKTRLDPAQSLRDRLVLLLEPLESPVDLVKVPEHVAAQLGDLALNPVKPTVYLGELAIYCHEMAP